jgi:hypothetical protein
MKKEGRRTDSRRSRYKFVGKKKRDAASTSSSSIARLPFEFPALVMGLVKTADDFVRSEDSGNCSGDLEKGTLNRSGRNGRARERPMSK